MILTGPLGRIVYTLELIEPSSINKVSLVQVSFSSFTASIRDDPYWTCRKNSLELIELSSINTVQFRFSPAVTHWINRRWSLLDLKREQFRRIVY